MREGREDYHCTTIETFVTPLRDVSLHRATLGNFAIYSNSPAGVRRVIDAQRIGGMCLADSSDFKYMRTVFPRADDKEETVRERLKVYRESTQPLLDHYGRLSMLAKIDGVGSAAEVEKRILAALSGVGQSAQS